MPIFVQVPCLQYAQLCCVTGIYIIWSDVFVRTPKKESPEMRASKKEKTLLTMCKPWFFSIVICLGFHQVGKDMLLAQVSVPCLRYGVSPRIGHQNLWCGQTPQAFLPCFTSKNERKLKKEAYQHDSKNTSPHDPSSNNNISSWKWYNGNFQATNRMGYQLSI